MSNKTLDTLRAARELLSDPDRWTKGVGARDAFGRPVSVHDESARCWCALGAVVRSSAEPFGDALSTAAKSALHVSLLAGEDYVWEFNDAPRTSHAMMLAMFDRAISRLEEEI